MELQNPGVGNAKFVRCIKRIPETEIEKVKSSLHQWGPERGVIKCRSSKILEMFFGILFASLWTEKERSN
jgi:hypothetical protein